MGFSFANKGKKAVIIRTLNKKVLELKLDVVSELPVLLPNAPIEEK